MMYTNDKRFISFIVCVFDRKKHDHKKIRSGRILKMNLPLRYKKKGGNIKKWREKYSL